MNKAFLVLASVLVVAYLAGWNLSKPKFDGKLPLNITEQITIAPIEQAITLAVTAAGQVLLVSSADAQGVNAVSLSRSDTNYTDAIDAYLAIGQAQSVSYTHLTLPTSDLV